MFCRPSKLVCGHTRTKVLASRLLGAPQNGPKQGRIRPNLWLTRVRPTSSARETLAKSRPLALSGPVGSQLGSLKLFPRLSRERERVLIGPSTLGGLPITLVPRLKHNFFPIARPSAPLFWAHLQTLVCKQGRQRARRPDSRDCIWRGASTARTHCTETPTRALCLEFKFCPRQLARPTRPASQPAFANT